MPPMSGRHASPAAPGVCWHRAARRYRLFLLCIVLSRIEFQFCCFWIRFVSQGVVCFHSVGFGGHAQNSQYAPCIFVDNPRKLRRKGNQVLPRLHTKKVISHFFLQLSQLVSQDSAKELCCLWRFLDSSFTVIFLNVSRGSTLFTSSFIYRSPRSLPVAGVNLWILTL
jgi:hypothetical protein